MTNTTYNYAAIGPVMYLCLFQASTWLTESLTAEKYAEYRDYQALVGRFLPRFSAVFSLESATLEEKRTEEREMGVKKEN